LVLPVDDFNSGCRGPSVGDGRSQARSEQDGTGGDHQRRAADGDTAAQPGHAAQHLSFLLRASGLIERRAREVTSRLDVFYTLVALDS
jgi:hypothetical protein